MARAAVADDDAGADFLSNRGDGAVVINGLDIGIIHRILIGQAERPREAVGISAGGEDAVLLIQPVRQRIVEAAEAVYGLFRVIQPILS